MTAPALDAAPELDRALTYVRGAIQNARAAQFLAREGDAAQCEIFATRAAEDAERAADRLRSVGASPVPETPRTNNPAPVADALSLSSLASLASLDTPDARALLSGLSELLPVAERIDREHGHWYENAPSTDTKGTDLAEAVHSLICRLELELSGPKSRRGE